MSVVACAGGLEVVGEIGRAVIAMQRFENAQTLAGICLQIEDTYLLASGDALAWIFGNLVSQCDLASAEKQQPPFGRGPRTSGTVHAHLGMSVRKHVRRLAGRASFYLCELVKCE